MIRILIAYATKHNTTREIAEAVAETLRSPGLEVDVAAADATQHGDLKEGECEKLHMRPFLNN
ncbi:MAG: hypothetical protein APR53_03510 [Methanoculleus sp. SDB]|nr:MAG: hypothetical protein APR53_03510 [Methanoculleus sp. SDB]